MGILIRARVWTRAIAALCFLTIALLLCGVTNAQTIASQCEPDASMREALRQVEMTADNPGYVASRERKFNQLRALLKEFPKVLAVHEQYQDTVLAGDVDSSSLLEEYRQLLAQHPTDSFYLYLYGRLLTRRKTTEAKTYLEQALVSNPRFAVAHLQLVEIYQTQQFDSEQERRRHLNAFIEQCPSSLRAYSYLRSLNDAEMLRERAWRLRELLYSRANVDAFSHFNTLWDLEFRITPQAQHAGVRTRINADLKYLRQLQTANKETWLRTLHAGYNQVGDAEGAAWAENEILKLLPHSGLALQVTRERWQKLHPEPEETSSKEQVQEYYRALLSATEEWAQLWPHSHVPWLKRLDALNQLSDVPPIEVERTADNLFRAATENAGAFRTIPPVSILVAGIYLKHNVRVARVPELVRAGLAEMDQQRARDKQSDQRSAEELKYAEANFNIIGWRTLLMLVDAHLRLKQPADVRRALEELATNLAQNKPASNASPGETANHNYFEAKYWESRARLAEIENRKLEALTYYKQATTIAPPEQAAEKSDLTTKMQQLWDQLGGTNEGWEIWLNSKDTKPTKSAVTSANGWQRQDLALPDFTLNDLTGRTWKLTNLRGKVVFINIWATWCKPCQAELPLIQELHERLKNRSDALVLTLNVDSDVGLIEPFMKSRRFSFPVLAAHDYVQRLRPDAVLPRSWVVSPNGVLQMERVGFDRETGWQNQVLDLINSAGSSQ